MSAKPLSLFVTTTHPLASAIAAMMASSAFRGFPVAVPSATRRTQTNPALSSNGSTRPSNSAEGPTGRDNHISSHPASGPGFPSTPWRTSATVSEARRPRRLHLPEAP